MRRFVAIVIAALFVVSCGRDVDLTVVAASAKLVDTPDPASAAAETLTLGAKLKGRRGKKGWWKVKRANGKEAYAPPEALAPFPVQGQPRWVVAPVAGQLAEADLASRAITARYEIGTPLEIVGGAAWLPPEIAAVVKDGVVIGYVPVKAIGDREPKAGDLLVAAREALLAGKLAEALMQGRRALSLDPKHTGARALVAAIHEANGDPEAAAMQDALVAPKTEPPPVVVKEGESVFVGSADLALHKGRGQTTEVLTRLPINTPVSVKAIEGPLAKVAWKGQPDVGANIDVDPWESAAAPPKPDASATATSTSAATPALAEILADEGMTIGWVLAGHLAPGEQNAEATAAVARQRLAEGKAADAAELFERAVTLAPSNLELTRELLAAAVQADRYLTAAFAALALNRGGEDLGGLEVADIELFYGCRGERWEAKRVSGASAPEAGEALPDDACVTDVDADPPCEPCAVYEHDDYYEEHGDCVDCGEEGVEEEATPEESAEEAERRRQIEEAEAAAEAAREAIAQAERDAAAEKERREHEAAVADHGVYLTKIDTAFDRAFDSGSWVYVEIKNRQAGRVAGAKLQIYRVPFSPSYGSRHYERDSLEVGEVELPPLGPNASVGLWFPVQTYLNVEYGVLRMGSLEEAREKLSSALGGNDMPPHVEVSVEGEDCSCGGC